MEEYQKISNIFKFDEKYRTILGINEPFNTLKDIIWQGTEKIDGTNVRIYWDGHSITVAGRTDKSQFNKGLKTYLDTLFLSTEMEYVFEQMFGNKEVYLFGEGYGAKIQADGELYSPTPKLIIFDIKIDGYDLDRENVNRIAKELGLDSVPVICEGTLEKIIEFVSRRQMSTIGNHLHEMEGLVLVPKGIQLYDKEPSLS
jgi:RNA ligase.